MRIDKMTASFGKLAQQTLCPGPGLNIIEAPNESGKSTWCAFLRTILYGIPTRERGALADKNRYAPWDGAPMQGSLELHDGERNLTVRRDTVRATSPMGHFSAVFSGTADPIPGLNSDNCGEILLGVSKEVFERSAFIRQSGLAVDQSPELERRIAALLSTGEEQNSFTEVYDALKKELNRHRHNRTGLLPALENEISELSELLHQSNLLQDRLTEIEHRSKALKHRAADLQAQLHQHELAARASQRKQIEAARLVADAAAEQSRTQQRAIEQDKLPSEDVLHQLSARLDSLYATDDQAKVLTQQLQQSQQAAETAHARLASHPFYPMTPERAAAQSLNASPRPKVSPALYAVAPLLGAVSAGVLFYFTHHLWLSLSIAVLLAIAILLTATLLAKSRLGAWEDEIARLRKDLDVESAYYTTLYIAATDAQKRVQQLFAEESALSATRHNTLQTLLKAVSLFAPVSTADDIRLVLVDSLARRKDAQKAEMLAREAKLRYDILCENSTGLNKPEAAVSVPTNDPAALHQELERTNIALTECARDHSRLEGERSAIGKHSELLEKREDLERRRLQLEREYQSLALAMETINDANIELQSRFSPALGREAGHIFSALTGKKYTHILLDRALNASASSEADSTPRSAALLSQGCADQLYLALRLAISRMVLPQDKQVPLILDDALTTFDDTRLAYALDWLAEEGKQRQILLFTCQSRERTYLAGRDNVTFLHL